MQLDRVGSNSELTGKCVVNNEFEEEFKVAQICNVITRKIVSRRMDLKLSRKDVAKSLGVGVSKVVNLEIADKDDFFYSFIKYLDVIGLEMKISEKVN